MQDFIAHAITLIICVGLFYGCYLALGFTKAGLKNTSEDSHPLTGFAYFLGYCLCWPFAIATFVMCWIGFFKLMDTVI